MVTGTMWRVAFPRGCFCGGAGCVVLLRWVRDTNAYLFKRSEAPGLSAWPPASPRFFHHEGTKDTKGEEKTEKILPQEAQKAQRVGKKRGRPAKVSGAWPGAMCSEDRPATGTAPPKKGGDRGTRRCSICGTPKGVTAFEAGGGMVCLVCRKKNAIRTDRAISKALAE